MANTGKLQATVAYKVRKGTDIPLDINGDPISESGLKQAIALLAGEVNPNPLLYEVETYFTEDGTITGNPTSEYSPDACPAGFIRVTPNRVVLSPETPTLKVKVSSSGAWTASASAHATIDPAAGAAGETELIITRTTLGQQFITFTNTVTGETARLYVINTEDPDLWVLDGGTWHNLGFWFNNGIWNY